MAHITDPYVRDNNEIALLFLSVCYAEWRGILRVVSRDFLAVFCGILIGVLYIILLCASSRSYYAYIYLAGEKEYFLGFVRIL